MVDYLFPERFPHKPYIKEGFPKNVTVLVNSEAQFECPTLSDSDSEPCVLWMRVSSDVGHEETPPNGTEILEVR